MEKILPQPAETNVDIQLKWLSEGENHILEDSSLTGLVRCLIVRINQLSSEVDYLKNRVNQLDSFHS